ncbi:MAG: cytochrome c precursor [Thiomonas sp. 14-64-326]|uniref:Putative cytochrome c n=2 Tax=Thiomonas TaxID=32012 RepID=D5X6H7_THIK1|nr:MAG: cytochrome c precursor [Thiomonas sp. 14-64-326]
MKCIKPLFAIGLFGMAAGLSFTSAKAQDSHSGHASIGVNRPSPQVIRGLYLVKISGCNDCHTPGYAESGGNTPQKAWMTGSTVGFQGPWGTTYPTNLRLSMQRLSEAQWLQSARRPTRPPMPWFALREMSDADLRAVYAAVRYLGPAGEKAPAFVPPGQTPKGQFIDFVPRSPSAAYGAK